MAVHLRMRTLRRQHRIGPINLGQIEPAGRPREPAPRRSAVRKETILETLIARPEGVLTSEFMEILGLGKQAVWRYLTELKEEGLIEPVRRFGADARWYVNV